LDELLLEHRIKNPWTCSEERKERVLPQRKFTRWHRHRLQRELVRKSEYSNCTEKFLEGEERFHEEGAKKKRGFGKKEWRTAPLDKTWTEGDQGKVVVWRGKV